MRRGQRRLYIVTVRDVVDDAVCFTRRVITETHRQTHTHVADILTTFDEKEQLTAMLMKCKLSPRMPKIY